MSKKPLYSFLRIFLILLFLGGLSYLALYIQLMNAPVSIEIQNNVNFPLSVQNRISDFEYLYDVLGQSFPYFQVKKRQYGIDWLSRKDEFIKRVGETKTDRQYYEVLNEILTLLQNGHTNIITPGSEYEYYNESYRGLNPWSQVYGNKEAARRYEYWREIVPDQEQLCVPIGFRYIEGNYYASRNLLNPERTIDELGVPMGSRLLAINGTDVDFYVKSLMNREILKFDNNRNKFKLNSFSIMSANDVTLTLELPDGERTDKVLKPQKPDTLNEAARSYPEHLYSTEILEGDIAYLKLPSMASSYVGKDRAGIRSFLEKIKGYSALIIDIRGNGGGSNDYWMKNIVAPLTGRTLRTQNYLLFRGSKYIKPFIKQRMYTDYFGLKDLKDLNINNVSPQYYFSDVDGLYEELEYVVEPDNPVGFGGKIVLLVDDNVYSSAEAFAAFAKATGWATLVGTRTGGDGIGFDPVPVVLPYSGLIVRFTADMGLNPDGTINEEFATEPHIHAEPSYRDFIEKIQRTGKERKSLSVKDNLPYDTILKNAIDWLDCQNP